MATKGGERLLPLPCGPGKHRPVECLRTTLAAIVAAHSTPSQSTTNVMEPDNPDLQAVDSSPTRFASLWITTLTDTIPRSLNVRAVSGYIGCTLLISFPGRVGPGLVVESI